MLHVSSGIPKNAQIFFFLCIKKEILCILENMQLIIFLLPSQLVRGHAVLFLIAVLQFASIFTQLVVIKRFEVGIYIISAVISNYISDKLAAINFEDSPTYHLTRLRRECMYLLFQNLNSFLVIHSPYA